MPTIVADENIPYVTKAFQSIGNVHVMDSKSIDYGVCRKADVLLVRSVTRVDEHLIGKSAVSFVGSATAGIDHIDRTYLRRRGIKFVYAPGSNAESVVEYVLAGLLQLSTKKKRSLEGLVLGIIGCGNIGGCLAERAPALGLHVLKHDPPLAQTGQTGFTDLQTVLRKSDIITLHVPGNSDTRYLIGEAELRAMKPNAWILNTARGDVIDNHALLQALIHREIDSAILDVWEGEPMPNLDLLKKVELGTPHIAGHSVDGKLQGTITLYYAVVDHFGIQADWNHDRLLQADVPLPITIDPAPRINWLDALTKHLYDIRADDRRMRKLLDIPKSEVAEFFRRLRRDYPPRRSFRRHKVTQIPLPHMRAVREGLCVGY